MNIETVKNWYNNLNDINKGRIQSVALIATLFIVGGIIKVVNASERHHHDIYNITNTTESNGTALAIAASQHQYDLSSDKWQLSAAGARFDGSEALSFGIGKGYQGGLINGSIGREDGKTGVGVGFSWKLK